MPKTVPPHIVTMAQAKLTVLRGVLASVRLETGLQGIQIQINGDDVAATPQKYPWYLEPGKYLMVLSKKGYASDTRRLVLKAGEHRRIKVELTSLAEVAKQRRAQADLLLKKDRTRLIGYSALVAGAALAVGAAVLYGVGASRGNEAFDGYISTNSKQEQERFSEQIDSAEGLLTGGHVMIGLAAAALGVSVWQLVSASGMEESAPPAGQGVGITATMAPVAGGAAFSISGSF